MASGAVTSRIYPVRVIPRRAQAIAGDKFSEELWDEKTFGLGNLSKDDWDALVKADSYRKFFLAELQPVLDSVHAAGKTPLVIGDKEDKVATFFQYQNARIVEAKKLIKEVSVDKTKTAAEACEDLRKDLLAAFQQVPPHNGCPLLIRMANSAADFSNTFHGDTTFPLAVFDPAEWAKEAVHMQVVRDADKAKTGNMFLPAADFRVIVTSTFSAGDAEGFLKGRVIAYPGICRRPSTWVRTRTCVWGLFR